MYVVFFSPLACRYFSIAITLLHRIAIQLMQTNIDLVRAVVLWDSRASSKCIEWEKKVHTPNHIRGKKLQKHNYVNF